MLSLEAARSSAAPLEFDDETSPPPEALGVRHQREIPLAEIEEFIDWSFYFTAWDLPGSFPKILDHPTRGEQARAVYEDGRQLLEEIRAEGSIVANATVGFWPANADGDDVVLWTDSDRREELRRLPMLRQQTGQPNGKPCRSLADFVAPLAGDRVDYVGGFAVTGGIGADQLAARYEGELDDYRAIMVKALADRLAEALAEKLHFETRKAWYAPDEEFDNPRLIRERYRGIRPAFGYPACPDHTPKGALFELLRAPELGIELTESFAMTPGASVSGLYFGHPSAKYFTVGRIGRDQVEDYARRSGLEVRATEEWLHANLGYDPNER